MKKLFGLLLSLMVVFGSFSVANADVIYNRTTKKTYITLDSIEVEENDLILKENFGITSYKTIIPSNKKSYTVVFRSNKSAKETKKIIKQVAKKIHGSDYIEKHCKEFRTYKVIVKAKAKNGKTYTYTINGHKIY